jgi:anthranilate synthase component 1
MYYPDKKEFLRLARKGNVIPVYKEISADLDTPVSAFLKIGRYDYKYLLESVEGQEKIARYSFLGIQPSLVFQTKGRKVTIIDLRNKKHKGFMFSKTPLEQIRKIMQEFKFVDVKGLPRFCGGFVGYIGYDTVRFFERLPESNPDELAVPDCLFVLTDTLLIFDHLKHTIKIVYCIFLSSESKLRAEALYQQALGKIDSLHQRLNRPIRSKREISGYKKIGRLKANLSEREFRKIVKKAKGHIRKGDIIQVVLSLRFSADIKGIKPFDIYRRLRSLNPSPYMFFLDFKDVKLIGSSPEMLVRCEADLVQTRPIAGTRPRGENKTQDEALQRELICDEKEKAEHLMLVDLGRNDLGRVCRKGKVQVTTFMSVERYSHVMHLVSEIQGRLQKDKTIYDVLKAAFPAGTVTGSPKIRAMEIIDELENTRRGPYAGCVGYFSFSGNLDTCITIRTIVIKKDRAYIQAGAGIVADSVPAREYREVVNKARAQIEAITKQPRK